MNKLDIKSSTIDKTIDLVKDFLEKLVGSTIEEAGLIMADNMKLRRFKNQLKIWEKAQKIVAEKGINPKQISLKTLVPLLELSSIEEEESLQDKWTYLIVNYVDSDRKYESAVFPWILNQLSSAEIHELEDLYKNNVNKPYVMTIEGVEMWNMVRVGVIEVIDVNSKTNIKLLTESSNSYFDYLIHSQDFKTYVITDLGKRFVECCTHIGKVG